MNTESIRYSLPKESLDEIFERCFNKKLCDFEQLFEKRISNNFQSTLNSKTKIIIIGTITPKCGLYFYISSQTKMYNIIDRYRGTNLCELRENINNKINLADNLPKLKTTLEANHIAFLDVFSEVIRERGSTKDYDILFGTLDYQKFQEIVNTDYKELKIVPTSKNAYELCKRIFEYNENLKKYLPKLEKYKDYSIFTKKESMLERWKKIF